MVCFVKLSVTETKLNRARPFMEIMFQRTNAETPLTFFFEGKQVGEHVHRLCAWQVGYPCVLIGFFMTMSGILSPNANIVCVAIRDTNIWGLLPQMQGFPAPCTPHGRPPARLACC